MVKRKYLTETHPYLIHEWDFDKNILSPDEITYGSDKKVWWLCRKLDCRHSWKASLVSRSTGGRGCPACSNRVVTHKNNLKVKFYHLSMEWDDTKNGCGADEVVPGSDKKVWWLCGVCGYGWKTSIRQRTYRGRGCLACTNQVVIKENSLSHCFPELSKELSKLKNKGITADSLNKGTGRVVWWECSVCDHMWQTKVLNRTINKSDCPKCSCGPVSKVSQTWLDSLNIKTREHYIKDLNIRVDGFDPKTNTVYEFLGDYWHGNPKIYSSDKINKHSKKSFGTLFKETQDRIKLLKSQGFNVVHIWELDFKEFRK